MTDIDPEMQYLLEQVRAAYGGKLQTTTDFEALAEDIDARTHQHISSSTLKRLWGYVRLQPRPRNDTLNLLARYAGRADFRELCAELLQTSGFLSADTVDSGVLAPGSILRLGWMPDRVVLIEHQGDGLYKVLDAGSSKLRAGDTFHARKFLKGHPLYIDDLLRDGSPLPPYVAGRSAGIISVETVGR